MFEGRSSYLGVGSSLGRRGTGGHFIGVDSFPAEFLKRESSVFKNLQKQSLREIAAMYGHDKSRALRVFEDQMGTRLTGPPVTLSLQESEKVGGLGI
jgi:hypothetical protein